MLNVYEELGETSRRQILAELRTGAKSVTELVEATGLKQPNVSNHLARMRLKNIVRATKVGRQVFYTLASAEVEAIVNAVFAARDGQVETVNLEELSKQYAKAGILGDEQTCSDIMETAFRAKLSMLEVYQDLLAPAMALVGTWYKVEAIDEAQEHMASSITERMMARTVQMSTPARRHGKVALLGCAPNGYHVIGLRMISDYLRIAGWKTLFLGANVPIPSYLAAVKQHKPQMVLISCAATESLNATVDLVKQLSSIRSRKNPFLIGVGGHCVDAEPAAFAAAGVDFTGRDLRSFASEVLPEIERSGSVPSSSQSFVHSNGHDRTGVLAAEDEDED
jgi:methanogenic corrinoid protein MtbC1